MGLCGLKLISNSLLKPDGDRSFSTSAAIGKGARLSELTIGIFAHPVSDLNKRSLCLLLLL